MALSSPPEQQNTVTPLSVAEPPTFVLMASDGTRYEIDLSPVAQMVRDILPNYVTMARPLSPADDVQRASIRALIASPLGKAFGLRPPTEVMQLPAYKANSLLFMAESFVNELLARTTAAPVFAETSRDGDTVRMTWTTKRPE